ncbi:MAG: type IV secretory system conjugative DNA transfer family protein [Proteobacteria bacterium]|nr:type IV secretory system conjugative DNA transfer family protein [Pseudomonadota bacterium]
MSRRRFGDAFGLFSNTQRHLHHQFEQTRARERAFEVDRFLANAEPSDLLGNGRLANYYDLQDANLLSGKGLIIGGWDGEFLTYQGDASLVTFLRAGGGKNINFIFNNLAFVKDRSFVVIDIKDGENAYCTADYRKNVLGQKCIFLNPFELLGFGNTKINPLNALLELQNSGEAIDSEYDDIAEIIIPTPLKKSSNDWVAYGSQQIISWLLNYLVIEDSKNLNVGYLWRFVNSGGLEQANYFSYMKISSDESVATRASLYEDMAKVSPKQWLAYMSEIQKAVSVFKPETLLEKSSRINEFDFALLKQEPHTVYIMLPSKKVESAAKWLGLIINHIIEAVAAARGDIRTTFILDEMPQYYALAILKGLRLYRARGLNFWMFAQSRLSLLSRWSSEMVGEIEDQAAVTIYKNVTEPSVLKDIEYWSGSQTILNRNLGHNGGVQQSGNAGLSESKRNVLQAEDILSLNQDQHIIRVSNMPHLIIADTVPYFAIPEWNEGLNDVRKMHAGQKSTGVKIEGIDE